MAVALLLVSGATVQRLVADVLSRDLLGPPDGWLARHFVAGTAEFASGNRRLGAAAVARRPGYRDHRGDRAGVPAVAPRADGRQPEPRTLTARATTSTTTASATADCTIMVTFAQRDSGSTSVGLNAVALVNARYR